ADLPALHGADHVPADVGGQGRRLAGQLGRVVFAEVALPGGVGLGQRVGREPLADGDQADLAGLPTGEAGGLFDGLAHPPKAVGDCRPRAHAPAPGCRRIEFVSWFGYFVVEAPRSGGAPSEGNPRLNESRAEHATPDERSELAVFHSIGKALTSTLNLSEVLAIIMEQIRELFNPSHWSLLLYDEDR